MFAHRINVGWRTLQSRGAYCSHSGRLSRSNEEGPIVGSLAVPGWTVPVIQAGWDEAVIVDNLFEHGFHRPASNSDDAQPGHPGGRAC